MLSSLYADRYFDGQFVKYRFRWPADNTQGRFIIKPVSVTFSPFPTGGPKTTNYDVIPTAAAGTIGTKFDNYVVYLDWLDPIMVLGGGNQRSSTGNLLPGAWFLFNQQLVTASTSNPAVVDSASFDRYGAEGNMNGRTDWTLWMSDLYDLNPVAFQYFDFEITCTLFKLQPPVAVKFDDTSLSLPHKLFRQF